MSVKNKSKLKPKNGKQKVKEVNKIQNVGGLDSRKWKEVKLKGHVISDDGAGLEGLIGLEVLENYDAKLIDTEKAKQRRKERLAKKEAAKGKTVGVPKIAPPLSIEEDEAPKKKSKKEKKRRTSDSIPDEDELDETYPTDRFALLRPLPPLPSPLKQNVKTSKKAKLQNSNEEAEEAPQLVPVPGALDIDDLIGWNGLGVPAPVLKAIAEKGFKSPTEIQAMSFPAAILGKKDILGAAETGSGKTLAFGIPLLAGILELKEKNVRGGIRKAPKVKGATSEPVSRNTEHRSDIHDINDDDDGARELTPPPEELAYYPEMPKSDDDNDDDSNDDDDNDDDGENKETQEKESIKQELYKPLYALVLTPTRELAVQVKDHLVAAAKYTGIKVATIFGGLSVAKQERMLKQCPEIIVATPGRLWELYQQDNPHLSKIDDVSFLVIDETDRMIEKGHFEELRSILKILNANEIKKHTRQNFVFSATLTLVHDLPEHMQRRNRGKRPRFLKQTSDNKLQTIIDELGISQPKIVDITRSQQTAQNLMECRLLCPIDQKDFYLYYFVQKHPGRTIVFCNSIDCVKRLATVFGILQCNPFPLHANMIQKQRLKNLERFRDNPDGLLIATDVAARGLDIPNVEHVIHYQVPRTSENYVHRSGRTARANKNGITVMIMEPGEVKSYLRLYRTLGRTEDLPLFPVSEQFFAAVKERVNLARDVDIEELKLRRTQTEIGWMKKHAEEMDMIIDGYNDEERSDDDEDPYIIERRRNRNRLDALRLQLKTLLSKPIFPNGFNFKYPTSSATWANSNMTGSGGVNGDESAVKALKKSIEENKLAKQMRNKKRKITS